MIALDDGVIVKTFNSATGVTAGWQVTLRSREQRLVLRAPQDGQRAPRRARAQGPDDRHLGLRQRRPAPPHRPATRHAAIRVRHIDARRTRHRDRRRRRLSLDGAVVTQAPVPAHRHRAGLRRRSSARTRTSRPSTRPDLERLSRTLAADDPRVAELEATVDQLDDRRGRPRAAPRAPQGQGRHRRRRPRRRSSRSCCSSSARSTSTRRSPPPSSAASPSLGAFVAGWATPERSPAILTEALTGTDPVNAL